MYEGLGASTRELLRRAERLARSLGDAQVDFDHVLHSLSPSLPAEPDVGPSGWQILEEMRARPIRRGRQLGQGSFSRSVELMLEMARCMAFGEVEEVHVAEAVLSSECKFHFGRWCRRAEPDDKKRRSSLGKVLKEPWTRLAAGVDFASLRRQLKERPELLLDYHEEWLEVARQNARDWFCPEQVGMGYVLAILQDGGPLAEVLRGAGLTPDFLARVVKELPRLLPTDYLPAALEGQVFGPARRALGLAFGQAQGGEVSRTHLRWGVIVEGANGETQRILQQLGCWDDLACKARMQMQWKGAPRPASGWEEISEVLRWTDPPVERCEILLLALVRSGDRLLPFYGADEDRIRKAMSMP